MNDVDVEHPISPARTWACDGCDAETTGRCAAVANPEDCAAKRVFPPASTEGGGR